uniref:uncharacterized protein LOC110598354 n=1 Tax=Ictidomys tridecemlineatus TaxID=43179 RepID=UPI001A9E8CA6|nr:uncharacterized protein LOC110598354 [Ictidomys tridecemlineatus]
MSDDAAGLWTPLSVPLLQSPQCGQLTLLAGPFVVTREQPLGTVTENCPFPPVGPGQSLFRLPQLLLLLQSALVPSARGAWTPWRLSSEVPVGPVMSFGESFQSLLRNGLGPETRPSPQRSRPQVARALRAWGSTFLGLCVQRKQPYNVRMVSCQGGTCCTLQDAEAPVDSEVRGEGWEDLPSSPASRSDRARQAQSVRAALPSAQGLLGLSPERTGSVLPRGGAQRRLHHCPATQAQELGHCEDLPRAEGHTTGQAEPPPQACWLRRPRFCTRGAWLGFPPGNLAHSSTQQRLCFLTGTVNQAPDQRGPPALRARSWCSAAGHQPGRPRVKTRSVSPASRKSSLLCFLARSGGAPHPLRALPSSDVVCTSSPVRQRSRTRL